MCLLFRHRSIARSVCRIEHNVLQLTADTGCGDSGNREAEHSGCERCGTSDSPPTRDRRYARNADAYGMVNSP